MNNEKPGLSRRSLFAAGAALAAASYTANAQQTADNTRSTSNPAGAVSVSILVDALKAVGEDGMALTLSSGIQPLTNHSRVVIGPAVTTKWQTGQGRMTGADVQRNMFEPLDAADHGSVWVIAGGGGKIVSLFGGIIGAACQRNGMAGAVTDNGCRDIATFNEVDFPVFAHSAVPFGPGDTARPVDANVPVICGGVEVHPGDTIAADQDGIVVIPKRVHDQTFRAAQDILKKEHAVMQRINRGVSLADAYDL